MKKRCRLLPLLAALVLLFTACVQDTSLLSGPSQQPVLSGGDPPEVGAQIALITTEVDFDTAFLQSVNNTLGRFAGEAGFSSTSYKTEENNIAAALATMQLAAKGGAKLVVAAGEWMPEMVQKAQFQYPDIDFILLDALPDDSDLNSNAIGVRFAAEQGGWIAGYAAIQEGLTHLACFNSQDPTAQQYALGFLMGAEAAAEELALSRGSILINTIPLLEEESAEQFNARISRLFQNGVKVIFTNDATVQTDALQAIRSVDGKAIALQTEPSSVPGSTVLTSVLLEPKTVLETLLSQWEIGLFQGGEEMSGTLENTSISLSFDADRMELFGPQQYDDAVEKFAQENLQTKLDTLLALDEEGNYHLPPLHSLHLSYVVIA